ncbi:MAG: hypothetical protein SO160_03500, partial [Lachnospiraceae bacterium]|nr:hypothetical protein [Lachnospiraceae bacterium]
ITVLLPQLALQTVDFCTFLCSHMCPQHDCFPGFHSKKNSERLEGLFLQAHFLLLFQQNICAKEAGIYFSRR